MADGVGTAYLGRSFFAALKFVKAELRALVVKRSGEINIDISLWTGSSKVKVFLPHMCTAPRPILEWIR